MKAQIDAGMSYDKLRKSLDDPHLAAGIIKVPFSDFYSAQLLLQTTLSAQKAVSLEIRA